MCTCMSTARATNVAQRSSSVVPDYELMWMELKPTTTGASFTVWAETTAYLLLAENYDNTHLAYEIGIGVYST